MKVFRNFDLSNFNSYRLQSICDTVYIPESEIEIVDLLQELGESKYVILGDGNNVILSKQKYNVPFVLFKEEFSKIEINETIIEAEAGATVKSLSETALMHGLKNAEFYYDIPSSVGGAVFMNAGTKEGETQNILYKVRYLDLMDGLVKERFNDEIEFQYRNSFFQNNRDKIILKAWFKLKLGDPEVIKRTMLSSKERRWEKQPREFPNCGSVFKRPPGKYVGPMLDELGLKGFSIGGAKVSEKHSGFIVNYNNASGKDILAVIKEVQKRVKERYKINLEIEQRII